MRYFLGFLIAIGLIVLVFILILKSFGGSASKTTVKPLVNYATTTTTVALTIDGPVTADQTHRALTITVGQDQALVNAYQGYQGFITNTKSYTNNPIAYAEFLRALDIAGYTKGDTDPAKADYRGYCPAGQRYLFDITDGSHRSQRFWATSCGNLGTFKGNSLVVRSLFAQQIPDYNQLASSVKLSSF